MQVGKWLKILKKQGKVQCWCEIELHLCTVNAQETDKPLGRNSSCLCSLLKSMVISCHMSLALTCQVSTIPAVLALEWVVFGHMAVKGWSFEKTTLEWLYHNHCSPLLSSCCLALNQLLGWHGSSSHTSSFCPNRHCPVLCVYRLPGSWGRLCALRWSSIHQLIDKDLTYLCLQGFISIFWYT